MYRLAVCILIIHLRNRKLKFRTPFCLDKNTLAIWKLNDYLERRFKHLNELNQNNELSKIEFIFHISAKTISVNNKVPCSPSAKREITTILEYESAEKDMPNFYMKNDLQLTHKSIRSVEREAFEYFLNVKVLNLHNNRIWKLMAGSLDLLVNLEQLDLSACQMIEIDSKVFDKLDNLISLVLYDNYFNELSKDAFSMLNRLEWLSLNNNFIDLIELDADLFKNLVNLKHLILRSNRITRLSNQNSIGLSILKTAGFRQLRSLDLSVNMIEWLDAESFYDLAKLKELFLTMNNIQRIDSDAFYDLADLKSIDLSYNLLKSVQTSWFRNQRSLLHLYLSHNFIRRLESGCFSQLTELRSLGLNSNYIESIDEDECLFENNSNLFQLDLSANRIRSIAKSNALNKLPRLNELRLSDNPIVLVEDYAFQTLGKLECLVMNSCQLSSLNKRIFHGLAYVEKLHLSSNKIETIEDFTFQNLTCLKELLLGSNLIKTLNRNTFNGLFRLAHLDLSSNLIEKLPYSTNPNIIDSAIECAFKDLNELKRLNLSKNKLEAIEGNMFLGLNKLDDLDLSNNRINRIEESCLVNLTKLTRLNLNDNQLVSIDQPVGVLRPLISLKHLSIKSNKLRSLKYDSLCKLENLALLDLSHNELENLDDHLFKSVVHLQKLFLNSNRLSCLSQNLFGSNEYDLPSIDTINLSENKLTEIKEFTFQSLINLQMLQLEMNQLTSVDQNAFIGMRNLERLILSKNSIPSFETGTFDYLTRLETLKVDNNKLHHFQIGLLKRLPKLKYLSFENSKMTNLSDFLQCGVDANQQLQMNTPFILDASFNSVYQLTGLNRHFPFLFNCYLQNNSLSRLEVSDFIELRFLYKLDLSFNQLESLDDERIFENLKSIEKINLSNNNLKSLNRNIFLNLYELKQLDLSQNLLTTLDDGLFRTLVNLEELHLKGNKFERLNVKELFASTKQLIELDLSNNQLDNRSFGERVFHFKSCPLRLERLDLSSNRLSDLGFVRNLHKLDKGLFSNNQIRSVPDEGVFDKLKHLKEIDLSQNRLRRVTKRTFAFSLTWTLESLKLSNNELEMIEEGAFDHLRKRRHLDLTGNGRVNTQKFLLENIKNRKIEINNSDSED